MPKPIRDGAGPRHVAIIMDGNGRWAQRRGRPRLFGHHAGAKRVRELFVAMKEAGEAPEGAEADVKEGNALSLPFADGEFDRIVAAEVLEHIHEDVQAIRELVRVLRPGGIIVNAPTGSWPTLAEDCEAAGVRGTGYRVSPNGATLAVISRLLDSGDVRVAVEQVFDLAEAPAAHRQIESGHTRGKIVLHVAEN